jgi:hypothetical protein
MERRWGDTNNRERAGVELNGLIQDIRATPEPPPPQRVADHDLRMFVREFVLGGRVGERSANGGPHAEQLEVVS